MYVPRTVPQFSLTLYPHMIEEHFAESVPIICLGDVSEPNAGPELFSHHVTWAITLALCLL